MLHGLGRHRSLLLLGAVGNLAIVVLYALTRTFGIPFLGPHAGEVEGVAPLGLTATASELALVVALGALALGQEPLGGGRATAAFGLALVLAFLAYGMLHDSHRYPPPHHHGEHHAALDPEPPAARNLPEPQLRAQARHPATGASGGSRSTFVGDRSEPGVGTAAGRTTDRAYPRRSAKGQRRPG